MQTNLDTVVAVLPEPYRALTVRDCIEIAALLQRTTRNPNACISKGQYKTLVEQLGARNHVLAVQVETLTAINKELEQQLAAGLDDGR